MPLSDRCDRCGMTPYAFSFIRRSNGDTVWLCEACVEGWHLEEGAEIIARQQLAARASYPDEPAYEREAEPAETPASRPRPEQDGEAADTGGESATTDAATTAGPDDRRGDDRVPAGPEVAAEPPPGDPGSGWADGTE